MDKFILDVLQLTAEYDYHGYLFWRTDGEYAPITFWVNCSDCFAWGSADLEKITPENLPRLKDTLVEVSTIKCGDIYGVDLFVARERKMRPAKFYFKHLTEEFVNLFENCGPERD